MNPIENESSPDHKKEKGEMKRKHIGMNTGGSTGT
jgi:hypothetical protein